MPGKTNMKLSVVDLSPLTPHGNRHEAVLNTLDTAQRAEEWGFSRIWLAEHHATEAMAGRAPELMIPLIAARTSRIRVGSGSVLLNHYSPFKVAELFSTMEDMFPGRIDMGIGRATTGPVADIALQRNRSFRQMTDDSDEQLDELIAWMHDAFGHDHPFGQIKVHKNKPGQSPPLWLLGSSPWSAGAAAGRGLRYAFAGFINPGRAFEIASIYRQQFVPASGPAASDRPELILALSIYCAETEEAAARMAAPVQVMFQRMSRGDLSGRLPDEDEAVLMLGGLPEPEKLLDPRRPPRILAGTPATLHGWLEEIASVFGASEIMVQCISHNHAARMRGHQLLARQFGLV